MHHQSNETQISISCLCSWVDAGRACFVLRRRVVLLDDAPYDFALSPLIVLTVFLDAHDATLSLLAALTVLA